MCVSTYISTTCSIFLSLLDCKAFIRLARVMEDLAQGLKWLFPIMFLHAVETCLFVVLNQACSEIHFTSDISGKIILICRNVVWSRFCLEKQK